MKRLMLVWVMILSLVSLGAICDTQVALDEEAAREYAIRVLSRPEIGCMDAESMHMDLLRDGDCWICYASSVDTRARDTWSRSMRSAETSPITCFSGMERDQLNNHRG